MLLSTSIHPLALGRALRLVVAQRLVRRLCDDCKADVTLEVPPQALIDLGDQVRRRHPA
jgi:type II secretory ATPase GspE/PulE/Tfp pilus assembly ATPase PilB-like protein